MAKIAYIRISTPRQNINGQSFELQKYARDNNFVFDKVVTEQCSGRIDFQKRELGKLMKTVEEGDIIYATEVSRFGRTVCTVMEFLSLCMRKGVDLQTLHDHYTLSKDPQSQILGVMYAYVAEMERMLNSQRIKEGLELRRLRGDLLGRPANGAPRARKLDEQKVLIGQLVELGVSIQRLAEIFKVDRQTIRAFLWARFNEEWLNRYNIRRRKKRDDNE